MNNARPINAFNGEFIGLTIASENMNGPKETLLEYTQCAEMIFFVIQHLMVGNAWLSDSVCHLFKRFPFAFAQDSLHGSPAASLQCFV